MPALSFDLSPDGRPLVDLYVSISSIEREAYREEDRPVPPAIPIRALVDTGAGRSHVDLDVLAHLGISRVSDDLIFTASGGPPVSRGVYRVDLAWAGDRLGSLAVDHAVFGSPIAEALRVGALLGRDILDQGILIYDGIARRFSLAYDPPSQP